MKKEELSKYIDKIGYEIIDDIISPMCGISDVIADLYLADIQTYEYDEKKAIRIAEKVFKKYGIKNGYAEIFIDKPIALLALFILEESNYLDRNQ